MNLLAFTDSLEWSVLGLTILHFLWQGAAIGFLTMGLLALMKTCPASWRYTTACFAMASCLGSFLITLLVLMNTASHPSFSLDSNIVLEASNDGALGATAVIDNMPTTASATLEAVPVASTYVTSTLLETVTGSIAMLWCLGFLVMSIRFLLQWRASRGVRRTLVEEPDASWLTLFDGLKRELGLSRSIKLLKSGLVRTPMVIGWFSPTVIVPIEAFTSLSREQLRLVLLHELHHITRLDPLVNLFQGILEALFFFHPVTWWLSKQIRVEREHCCDDRTLTYTNQPRIFAEALYLLESLRAKRTRMLSNVALQATGGTLMTRISRILKIEPTTTTHASGWRTPLALVLASAVAATCIANLSNEAIASSPEVAAQDRGQDRRARGDASSQELPSAEAVEARVKAGVESGRITEEQAKEIMKVHKRFAMGVESGRLSSEEADEMFGERVRAMMSGQGEAERKPKASSKGEEKARANRLGLMMIELGKALESGEITPEQAIERVMGAVRRMEMADQQKMRAEYAEAEKKMAAMVEKGEITREQMAQRLGEMRRAMAGGETRTITKQDYAEAEKKMAAMVEKGEITREQMAQRLGEMRRAMAGEETRTFTRQDYAEAEKKMTAMVEKGEITREQMAQRLGEMRRMIASEGQKRERVTRQDYAEAQEKMEEMVRNGEITREQMQERLDAMRHMIAE